MSNQIVYQASEFLHFYILLFNNNNNSNNNNIYNNNNNKTGQLGWLPPRHTRGQVTLLTYQVKVVKWMLGWVMNGLMTM